MTAVPPLPEIEAYAERIRAAIWQAVDGDEQSEPGRTDRRRVDRDVEGLREHYDWNGLGICGETFHQRHLNADWPCPDARRCWAGLRDAGALYGEPWT